MTVETARTTIPDARTLHARYHCVLLRAAERSPGGIVIPETAFERDPRSDALVLDHGPGYAFDTGIRFSTWASVGDRILFPPHAFHELRTNPEEGWVHDRDLAGVIYGPHHRHLTPANNYLLVDPDAAEDTYGAGVIQRPEDCRATPNRGTVVEFGPGTLRLHGPRAGMRDSVLAVLGLHGAGELIGKRIAWAQDATIVTTETQILVPASAVCAVLE